MTKHKVNVKIDNDENEKIKTSMFLLTINSNKAVKTKKEPFALQFKKQVYEILENLPEYIKVNANALPDNNMIINVKCFIEIGEKLSRLHSHSIIEIKHNSSIQLDSKKISSALGGYYVNITFMRSSNDINRMINYIKKSF